MKILKFAKKLLEREGYCKVLDFGGGPGELSLLLHDIGCDVAYADLPGVISDFAMWRFRKYGASIKVIYSRIDGIDLPVKEFNLIVSDATIEHLKREYLKTL